MTLKTRRLWIKGNLLLRQNAAVLVVIALWCAANFLIFWSVVGRGAREALLIVFYFEHDSSSWGNFYATFSDLVIFAVIVSVVMSNLHRRYQPEQTCRLLAEQHRDQALIIGYSHLGQRVAELLSHHGVPFVILEEQRGLVEDLIRKEQPLIVGSPCDTANLAAAKVSATRLVLIATDDIETAVTACHLVRQSNRTCALLCRCFHDEVGDVLSKVYNAQIVSTSRMAARFVAEYAKGHRVRSCVIVGGNSFGRRLVEVMKEQRAEFFLIEPNRTLVEDLIDHEPVLIGQVTDPDLLARAKIAETNLVVLADDNVGGHLLAADHIRDANRRCRIICRVHQEGAAEVLTRDPFRCDVISTSRHTVEMLVKQGAFGAVGIEPGVR